MNFGKGTTIGRTHGLFPVFDRVFLTLVMVFAFISFAPVPAPADMNGIGSPRRTAWFPNDSAALDLRNFPVYFRAGFDPLGLKDMPDESGGIWRKLESFPKNGAPLIVKDLPIPSLPRRFFLSPIMIPEMEFTFLIPFELTKELKAVFSPDQSGPVKTPGMYLDGLGDNWEIYLNGELVRSEMHLDDRGRIQGHRAVEGLFFPVPAGVLREGGNILVFRILGDPSHDKTGIFGANAFYLGDYEGIVKQQDESFSLGIVLVFFFIALYCFFMFLGRLEDRHNLFFAGFAFTAALCFFMRTRTVYALIPDTAAVYKVEYAACFLIIPLFAFYGEILCRKKLNIISKCYGGICFVLALLLFVFSPGYSREIFWLWQFSFLPMLLFVFVYDILLVFLQNVQDRRKARDFAERGSSESPGSGSLLQDWVYTLWETPGGNLLAGALVITFCVAFDTASFLLFRKEPPLSRYGLIFVILGNSFMFGRQVNLLYTQISNRNRKLAAAGKVLSESSGALKRAGEKLDQKIKELTAAHTRIAISEKQYGDLFNGIRDPVAILDGNLRFKRANHGAAELFDLEDIDLEDRTALVPTLADRLYEGASDRESLLEQFWNSVYALKLNKAPTELEAFVWPEKQEKPIFCALRMEYQLSTESGFEIFVRAVILEKSSLAAALVSRTASTGGILPQRRNDALYGAP
ncbi:MAG: hypothetical protein LBT16_11265 [Treponema sp.]|jgi:PAS domain-containing protein|nr:hypothetical protein [Treponema sp.]